MFTVYPIHQISADEIINYIARNLNLLIFILNILGKYFIISLSDIKIALPKKKKNRIEYRKRMSSKTLLT